MTSTQAIIERTLAAMDYEVVDVERGQQGVLRVFIDAPSGITLDDCEKVSRQLSYVLEVEGIDYARLEVSSPGLDRPLKKPADFERFAGAEVAIRLREPLEGRRNFDGLLTVEDDGRFGLELIERAPEESRTKGARAAKKARPQRARSAPPKAVEAPAQAARKLVFSLDEIERARLVPKLKSQERRK
ncbi:MAG: ribosome maturation factor RimP [Burkholderiaceae bacterium]|nr:ribosome maturation factor RimP [Burkholderiaceae bacterium]